MVLSRKFGVAIFGCPGFRGLGSIPDALESVREGVWSHCADDDGQCECHGDHSKRSALETRATKIKILIHRD